MEWGQLSINSEPVGDFQGVETNMLLWDKFWSKARDLGKEYYDKRAEKEAERKN